MTLTTHQQCAHCGAKTARQYQLVRFDATDQSHNSEEMFLCVRCARAERKRLQTEPEAGEWVTRHELISMLDRFFAASGVFDICARCHQQGTGCCPTTCRVMDEKGCDPNNKFGKTVFCATFVCSALLNAIAECDTETARALKWIKRELGVAEFPIYEMITRVPAEARDPIRPLLLPRRYPKPPDLNGDAIKEKLLALTKEVLTIRQLWREEERQEAKTSH